MAGIGEDGPKARVILQQCMSACLQVQPKSSDTEAQFVEIGRGLVVYLCFLKDATAEVLDKIVKSVLSAQLSEGTDGRLVSVLDLPGDILIIPQATLGGTLKGKRMQYHRNVGKEDGGVLYGEFISRCRTAMQQSGSGSGSVCQAGTYGIRQVFSCKTNGPYTHFLEF